MNMIKKQSRLLSMQIKTVIRIFLKIKNPAGYLYDRLFNPVKKTYTLRDGTKAILYTVPDRGILQEIFLHNQYTPKGFDISKQDIVFDIGAQRGMFTIYAAKKAKQVFSFEPVTENYNILRDNVRINKLKNVVAINKGALDKNGSIKLYLDDDNSGGHSIYVHKKKQKFINMKVTTIPAIMKKHSLKKINFLKMDCEGSEYNILYNLPKEILHSIDKISMEYHAFGDHAPDEMRKFLESNGFEVKSKDAEDGMTVGILYAINKRAYKK